MAAHWSVKTDGKDMDGRFLREKNGYIEIAKIWEDGEELEIEFGMKITAAGLPDSENVYAFKYGPVLLSADLGFDDMEETTTGVNVTVPENKIAESEILIIDMQDGEDIVSSIDSCFTKDISSMKFTFRGADRSVEFGPHYKKNKERHGIYWYITDGGGRFALCRKHQSRSEQAQADYI